MRRRRLPVPDQRSLRHARPAPVGRRRRPRRHRRRLRLPGSRSPACGSPRPGRRAERSGRPRRRRRRAARRRAAPSPGASVCARPCSPRRCLGRVRPGAPGDARPRGADGLARRRRRARRRRSTDRLVGRKRPARREPRSDHRYCPTLAVGQQPDRAPAGHAAGTRPPGRSHRGGMARVGGLEQRTRSSTVAGRRARIPDPRMRFDQDAVHASAAHRSNRLRRVVHRAGTARRRSRGGRARAQPGEGRGDDGAPGGSTPPTSTSARATSSTPARSSPPSTAAMRRSMPPPRSASRAAAR